MELFKAINDADISRFQELVKKGEDINHVSENGWTPLLAAVYQGCAEMVVILLKKGARLDNIILGKTAFEHAENQHNHEIMCLIATEEVWRQRRAFLYHRYS